MLTTEELWQMYYECKLTANDIDGVEEVFNKKIDFLQRTLCFVGLSEEDKSYLKLYLEKTQLQKSLLITLLRDENV